MILTRVGPAVDRRQASPSAGPESGLLRAAVVGEWTRQAVSSSAPGRTLPERFSPGVDNRGVFGDDGGMTVARVRRRPCPLPPAAGNRLLYHRRLYISLSLSLFNNRAK